MLKDKGYMRSARMARNRYLRMVTPMRANAKNVCRKCGKLMRGHTCLTEEERTANTILQLKESE